MHIPEVTYEQRSDLVVDKICLVITVVSFLTQRLRRFYSLPSSHSLPASLPPTLCNYLAHPCISHLPLFTPPTTLHILSSVVLSLQLFSLPICKEDRGNSFHHLVVVCHDVIAMATRLTISRNTQMHQAPDPNPSTHTHTYSVLPKTT